MTNQPNSPDPRGQGQWVPGQYPAQAPQPQSYPSAQRPPQSYPSAQPPQSYASAQPSAANRADDGPLTALTDFSFKKYATPTLIKIIYIVLLIAVGLGLLIGLGTGVAMMAFTLETAYSDEEVAAGILVSIVTMIASLLGSLVSVLLVRTGLEFVIASIRTARNTETILDELAEIKAQGTKI